ncbi:MAG: hypothetical protein MPJ25_07745, partial [Pirellulales bacterium]|nr:hypothetical protein [Pirellulales bacterium]
DGYKRQATECKSAYDDSATVPEHAEETNRLPDTLSSGIKFLLFVFEHKSFCRFAGWLLTR